MATFLDPYNQHIREIGKETERERIRMIIVGLYGIHGGPEMNQLREKYMLIINHYNTSNMQLLHERCEEYLKHAGGRGTKNYNINKIKLFKDIPDGIEILIDYVDITAIRCMNIPSEIIYESIYKELPELFEE